MLFRRAIRQSGQEYLRRTGLGGRAPFRLARQIPQTLKTVSASSLLLLRCSLLLSLLSLFEAFEQALGAVSGKDPATVWAIMDDFMNALQVVSRRAYTNDTKIGRNVKRRGCPLLFYGYLRVTDKPERTIKQNPSNRCGSRGFGWWTIQDSNL